MAFDKAKFLARFIDEAKEHIQKLNDGVLALEKNPQDTETLNAVFRSAHTIKGSSRMMKLIPISELAHKIEDVLDAFRQNKIQHSKALSHLLFKGIDAIDSMLDRISSGDEVTEVPEKICEELEKAAQGEIISLKGLQSPEPVSQENTPPPPLDTRPPEPEKVPLEKISEKKNNIPDAEPEKPSENEESLEPALSSKPSSAEKRTRPPETIRISSDKLDELIKLMGEIVSGHSRSRQRLLEFKEIEKISKKNMELISSLESESILSRKQKEDILNSAASLYLNIKKMAAVFKEDVSIRGLLANDLQDRSLKMRMVPLSTIFDSFRRTVRYISRTSEKDIEFIIEGGDTELDKKIVEQISDPLVHMIRNSIDHGIENPRQRVSAGKSETGTIKLSAEYEGGNVLIELSDDGAGISVKKIKEKALKKKMFTRSEIENIPEAEIINLIFQPGFSSSDIITDLSGRGVGMDVVKRNIIENLKGSIHIETKEDAGTSFYIRLPLTMAIIHVLFIKVSHMTFAVPANFIKEIISVPEEEIISVMDKKAVRLREQIIPIVHMNDILMIPQGEGKKPDIDNYKEFLILITSVGNEKLGVIIDALLDEEDMVIKPLPSHMKNIPFVSGGIISGTNEIFNVLHMPKIMAAAKEMKIQTKIKMEPEKEKKEKHILVVDDSVSTREIEKSILESYGYMVSLAGDGAEAFEKAKNFQYDLIITDVEMPNLDGFSLTEKLKKDEMYVDIPVILVTSLDKEEDKKKGIRAGADAYIIKGDFEQSTLLETVQNLVG